MESRERVAAPKRKKCAVCLSGQARHFESGHNILSKFMKNNKDIDFDVFFQVWYDSASPFYETKGGRVEIPKNLIDTLIQMYKPKDYIVQKPMQFNPNKWGYPADPRPNNRANHISQFFAKNMVRNLIENFQNSHGIRYDFVLMTRFDLSKDITLQLNHIEEGYNYFSSFCRRGSPVPHLPPPDNITLMSIESFLKVYNMYNDFHRISASQDVVRQTRQIVQNYKNWGNGGCEVCLLATLIYHELLDKCRFVNEIPDFR